MARVCSADAGFADEPGPSVWRRKSGGAAEIAAESGEDVSHGGHHFCHLLLPGAPILRLKVLYQLEGSRTYCAFSVSRRRLGKRGVISDIAFVAGARSSITVEMCSIGKYAAYKCSTDMLEIIDGINQLYCIQGVN